MKPGPNESRGKSRAVSQRRDEYLRATGGEIVPHRRHHRHHHGRHRQSSGWTVALFGLGVLALLIAGVLWWLMSQR